MPTTPSQFLFGAGFYFMENKKAKKILSREEIKKILYRLAHQVLEKAENSEDIALIGIQTRGVFIAKRLGQIIKEIGKKEIPFGILDITFYRDDLTVVGPQPIVKKTAIGFDITNKEIILVDDVLFTGRTIRAALDQIMDFGRPKRVSLAVLVDRGHRELPIRADFVGKNIPTSSAERVDVDIFEVDGKDQVLVLRD